MEYLANELTFLDWLYGRPVGGFRTDKVDRPRLGMAIQRRIMALWLPLMAAYFRLHASDRRWLLASIALVLGAALAALSALVHLDRVNAASRQRLEAAERQLERLRQLPASRPWQQAWLESLPSDQSKDPHGSPSQRWLHDSAAVAKGLDVKLLRVTVDSLRTGVPASGLPAPFAYTDIRLDFECRYADCKRWLSRLMDVIPGSITLQQLDLKPVADGRPTINGQAVMRLYERTTP